MPELGAFLTAINSSKEDVIGEDASPQEAEKSYKPYIINHLLANFIDAILQANEMNRNPGLDNRMQFDYLVHALRPRKRFSKWLKPDAIDNLELVKEFYNYNNRKAKAALQILSPDQIEFIRAKLDRGGMKKVKSKP